MPSNRSVLLGLAIVVAAVAAAWALIGGGADEPLKTVSSARVDVRDGMAVGGIRTFHIKQGTIVVLTVVSDAGGEVHLHGYDMEKEIPAGGGEVRFRVPADSVGRYELELHGTDQQLATIEVDP